MKSILFSALSVVTVVFLFGQGDIDLDDFSKSSIRNFSAGVGSLANGHQVLSSGKSNKARDNRSYGSTTAAGLNDTFDVEGRTDEIQPWQTEVDGYRPLGLGDQWTYEVTGDASGGSHHVTFETYKVVDTLFKGNRRALQILHSDGGIRYMYQDGAKVYFWDDLLSDFSLTYDYDERAGYYSHYYNSLTRDVDSVYITVLDTGVLKVDGQMLAYQKVEIGDHFGLRQPGEVLIFVDIGFASGGLFLGAGLSSTGEYMTTDLRCFNSIDVNVNFKEYVCDSTWRTTSVFDLPGDPGFVYPNPVSDKMTIQFHDNVSPIGCEIYIFSTSGRVMWKGGDQKKSIVETSQWNPGVYTLLMQMKDTLFTKRVIIIK